MLEVYREVRSLKGSRGGFGKDRRNDGHTGYGAGEEPAEWQDPTDLDYVYGDSEAQPGDGEESPPPDEYMATPEGL